MPTYKWILKRLLWGVLSIEEKESLVKLVTQQTFQLTQFEPSRELTYTLILGLHCGCDGWKFRRDCKHMTVFKHMREKGEV